MGLPSFNPLEEDRQICLFSPVSEDKEVKNDDIVLIKVNQVFVTDNIHVLSKICMCCSPPSVNACTGVGSIETQLEILLFRVGLAATIFANFVVTDDLRRDILLFEERPGSHGGSLYNHNVKLSRRARFRFLKEANDNLRT